MCVYKTEVKVKMRSAEFKVNNSTSKVGFEVVEVEQNYKRGNISVLLKNMIHTYLKYEPGVSLYLLHEDTGHP